MPGDDVHVRVACLADADAIAAIFGHHVLNGTASYETDPPSSAAMRDKMESVLARGWPFLVADVGGQVVGFAYATQFRDRPAYRHAAENSIYIAPDLIRQGIGRLLLTELCGAAQAVGFRQIVAVVGGADPASIALHEAHGFIQVGRLAAVGWKHGRWLDSVYLQRALGSGATTRPRSTDETNLLPTL